MVSPEKEDVERLVSILAHARLRPGMYIGVLNPDTLRAFVNGFYISNRVLESQVERQIWPERGWNNSSSLDATHQMQQKGLGINEIILETFTIIILAIQRQYGIANEPVTQVHRFIRLTNEQILNHLQAVLATILAACGAAPPLHEGEGDGG